MLSKRVSSTIFKVFGMKRLRIELRSPGPLANTLLTWPMSLYCTLTYIMTPGQSERGTICNDGVRHIPLRAWDHISLSDS